MRSGFKGFHCLFRIWKPSIVHEPGHRLILRMRVANWQSYWWLCGKPVFSLNIQSCATKNSLFKFSFPMFKYLKKMQLCFIQGLLHCKEDTFSKVSILLVRWTVSFPFLCCHPKKNEHVPLLFWIDQSTRSEMCFK